MKDVAAELTKVLLAWLPAAEAEEKARQWLEVTALFEGCTFRPPRDGPRMADKGWELRLVVSTADDLANVREGLRQLGVGAGRPYAHRGSTVLPVYGRRYAWFPALVAATPPRRARPVPEPEPPRAVKKAPRLGVKPRRAAPRAERAPRPPPAPSPSPPPSPSAPPLVLRVAATDTGFEASTFRGRSVWAGGCHGCGDRIVVAQDGRPVTGCLTTALCLAPGADDPAASVILCVTCSLRARRWAKRPADDPARAADVARWGAARAARIR